MTPFAVLALYPSWSFAVLVAATSVRLGRTAGRGLVALSLFFALWIGGLVLVKSQGAGWLAERIVPSGMLLAAGFVHAGADVMDVRDRRWVSSAYVASGVVAIVGAVAPSLLYAPGMLGPGPLFIPLAAVSVAGTLAVIVWLVRGAFVARGRERRRCFALACASVTGSIGGGAAISGRIFGVADVDVAAPFLLVAVGLTAYAVLGGEHGRARRLIVQGAVYAVLTAGLSAFGLVVFFALLPRLTPDGGRSVVWLVVVTFFAALPLDALRVVVVERLGRAIFRDPIGVGDLAAEVERTETRADHAERLAEIGTVASAVAHEIRNPLGIIAAQAKLLERAGAPASSVAALRAQVDRARRFVDDLLRYSRPRPLEIREVEVVAALEHAILGVRQGLGDNAPPIGLVPSTRDAARDLAIEADRDAFNDVATVLVHNAAVALDGRSDGKVAVRVAADRDDVRVIVEDNGAGVPPEIEATLFQPFVTGRGRDSAHPGTGLGLAIAARWVERHGGDIRHERPREGGARFVVRWPRAVAAAAVVEAPARARGVP